MCDRCEESITTIAERTAIPRSIVAEVYAAQKVILEEADAAEAVAMAQEIAEAIESGAIDLETMAREKEEDATAIPGFIMEALVAGIGGPVVVLGAVPHGEGGEAMLTIQCAGTGGPELAGKMCTSAAETLASPIIETGGVGPDGAIVSPMRRRSTRPEQ